MPIGVPGSTPIYIISTGHRMARQLHAFTTGRKCDSSRLIPIAPRIGARIIHLMEQRITHACGHQQEHYLTGFASQQDRKANWLRTTKCRSCFIADKSSERVDAAARDQAAIAHVNLPHLYGSDRQVAWATTIRTGRLASLIKNESTLADDRYHMCLLVTEAKWWIDHRSLDDFELLSKVSEAAASFDTVTV